MRSLFGSFAATSERNKERRTNNLGVSQDALLAARSAQAYQTRAARAAAIVASLWGNVAGSRCWEERRAHGDIAQTKCASAVALTPLWWDCCFRPAFTTKVGGLAPRTQQPIRALTSPTHSNQRLEPQYCSRSMSPGGWFVAVFVLHVFEQKSRPKLRIAMLVRKKYLGPSLLTSFRICHLATCDIPASGSIIMITVYP